MVVKEKKKKTKWWIVWLILAIIACLGAVLGLIYLASRTIVSYYGAPLYRPK